MKFVIDSGLKGQILRLLPLTEPQCSSDTFQGGEGVASQSQREGGDSPVSSADLALRAQDPLIGATLR